MGVIEYILLVALCAASISFTITTTSMFKWLREGLSPIHTKIEELMYCPYCFSHYVVLVILFCTNSVLAPVTSLVWFNFLFTWFVIVCIVAVLHYILLRAYEPVAKAMMSREIMKLKNIKK